MKKRPACDHVSLVEVFELTGSFEAFEAAARTALRRLEAEGVSGLVNVQFYATPDSSEVGAILIFADPDQFMEHVQMIMGWREFKDFVATVKPIEVRVYGRLGPEAHAWLRGMNVVSRIYENHVAGFVR